MPNAVPDFLIIGAMKAGTTTLFRDLAMHPMLYLPEEKEPETLVVHGTNVGAVLGDYRSLFLRAGEGRLKGEASTAYTKRPDHEGAADMALEVCGPTLKLIYLTRDPLKRIVSQYRHEFGLGEVSEDINTAVLKYPRYVAYSRYEWQLAPWRKGFGESNLLVLSFEDYIGDRQNTVRRVCKFLGVDPMLLPNIDVERAFNANDGKLVPKGFWKGVVASKLYQRSIKPWVPRGLRERLAARVLSPANLSSGELSVSVTATISEMLRGE